jgi:small subunit ribosomal protein S5
MTDQNITIENTVEPVVAAAPEVAQPEVVQEAQPQADTRPDNRGRRGARGQRGKGQGRERERKEFEQATIDVRRVARVMAGGRRFSFSVAVVIGDKKGRVGVGLGKAGDTALAIDKAVRDARKHLVVVPLTKDNSIAKEISYKYASSTITIIPSAGRGLVAGSAVRTVLEYAGISNVVSKILSRTKNKLTIARATLKALKQLSKAK